MNYLIIFFFLFSPCLSLGETLVGTAYNEKGIIVYEEKHSLQKDNQGFNKYITVEYKDPKGVIFAKMTSDFSKNIFVPDTVFEDYRFKITNKISVDQGKVYFSEYQDNLKTRESSVVYKDKMVASQGFDNFIRAHKNDLENGKVEFSFGVMSLMGFYSLTGYKMKSQEGLLEYGIKSSSWFVRLFTSELKVTYIVEGLRLKTFSGRSNLLDNNQKPQDVLIKYRWE